MTISYLVTLATTHDGERYLPSARPEVMVEEDAACAAMLTTCAANCDADVQAGAYTPPNRFIRSNTGRYSVE
jgi:hypothetical protein